MSLSKNVKIELEGISHIYDVGVGNDLLADSGVWTKRCLLPETHTVAIVSNAKVFGFYGEIVKHSLENKGFKVCVWLMKDGEEYKNFESLLDLLSFLSEYGLKRSDSVLALGGGVVGDLAGFASAIYLRGIQFLQIPTTFLSMIDSSVGGKTGVNTGFGKNLAGVFYQPKGVLVDVKTLTTLEERELRAGFCEAIKHGVLSGTELLKKTGELLENHPVEKIASEFGSDEFTERFENLVVENIAFKSRIVAGDEFEKTIRRDAKSRKTLNLGHTTAHALEKITEYKHLKHGEAVGYGILVAAKISEKLEMCDQNSIKLLNDVVSGVGTLPDTNDINVDDLMKLFAFDKKSLSNSLQWILLEAIGEPRIVSGEKIPNSVIRKSLVEVLHR